MSIFLVEICLSAKCVFYKKMYFSFLRAVALIWSIHILQYGVLHSTYRVATPLAKKHEIFLKNKSHFSRQTLLKYMYMRFSQNIWDILKQIISVTNCFVNTEIFRKCMKILAILQKLKCSLEQNRWTEHFFHYTVLVSN